MEEYFKKKTLPELKDLCKIFNIKPEPTKDKIIKKLLPVLKQTENTQLLPQHFPAEIVLSIKNFQIPPSSCCRGLLSPLGDLTCSKCKEFQHKQCVLENSKINPYLCPSCILEKISPLEPVCETLVKAFRLSQNKFLGFNYEIEEISFEISDEKKNEIVNADGMIQVQARCIRMDGTSIHHVWPVKGVLLVNHKVAMKFETSGNPNARKRKDEPLNLTTLMNSGVNTIAMVIANDQNTYYMNLVVIRKKTEQELINEIKENNYLTVDKSKEFIRNLLVSRDPDLISGSFMFELKCPLTMKLIKSPVRGINCSHIGCFDLEPYIGIQSTSKVNRWKCPLCHSYVYEMTYDLFIKEMIDKTEGEDLGAMVEISPNADYRILHSEEVKSRVNVVPVKRQPDLQSNPTKLSKTNEIIFIDLDSD